MTMHLEQVIIMFLISFYLTKFIFKFVLFCNFILFSLQLINSFIFAGF